MLSPQALNHHMLPLKAMRTFPMLIIVIAILAALAVIQWPHIAFLQLTGRFYPVRKVETLHAPVAIVGWTEEGLHLADHRTMPLLGVRKLPQTSAALTEVVKRGVQIHSDGRVYGLVRIHHWCGYDPVREHIARVDVA